MLWLCEDESRAGGEIEADLGADKDEVWGDPLEEDVDGVVGTGGAREVEGEETGEGCVSSGSDLLGAGEVPETLPLCFFPSLLMAGGAREVEEETGEGCVSCGSDLLGSGEAPETFLLCFCVTTLLRFFSSSQRAEGVVVLWTC